MELVLEGNSQTLQIRVIGELVSDSCSDLRDTVLESSTRGTETIVIDMRDSPFIDTSGLGVLVGLRSHLKKKGTGLRVANPSPKVKQALRMARLMAYFGLPDEE